MPSAQFGFTGEEIVNHVVNYVGNTSSEFSAVVANLLPLAEFRYCKMHDWKFLRKQNLELTVASGTDSYLLDSGSIGFYMKSSDVEQIWSEENGTFLRKIDLDTFRRMDLKQDDGSATAELKCWTSVGDNQILVYPKEFEDTELKIDGKITPTALVTLSNYPTIPYQYQEGFIKYVLAQALERENDSRADSIKQEALLLIRQDMQNDIGSGASSADEPRMHMWWEASLDGIGGELEALYLASLFA